MGDREIQSDISPLITTPAMSSLVRPFIACNEALAIFRLRLPELRRQYGRSIVIEEKPSRGIKGALLSILPQPKLKFAGADEEREMLFLLAKVRSLCLLVAPALFIAVFQFLFCNPFERFH